MTTNLAQAAVWSGAARLNLRSYFPESFSFAFFFSVLLSYKMCSVDSHVNFPQIILIFRSASTDSKF